eukprot:GILJ01018484.1.p1 GENE.GILJ01018484.1~~GILJ01018484.1.p1  ORF type:complete len:157 (-),score=10.02 GILJ01018484.1:837-1307(-)
MRLYLSLIEHGTGRDICPRCTYTAIHTQRLPRRRHKSFKVVRLRAGERISGRIMRKRLSGRCKPDSISNSIHRGACSESASTAISAEQPLQLSCCTSYKRKTVSCWYAGIVDVILELSLLASDTEARCPEGQVGCKSADFYEAVPLDPPLDPALNY